MSDGEKEISKGSSSADKEAAKSKPKRKRTQRPFPASSYGQATELAEAMLEIGGGTREVRRVTLFDHIGRSPESGPSRQLVTNSAKYGLTEGSYKAESLKLTEHGYKAVNPESSPRDSARAKYLLAIDGIPLFKALYDRFVGNKLPAQQVMRDFLVAEHETSEEDAREAVELFILNAREIGLVKTLSGAERILTLDHLLDDLPSGASGASDLKLPTLGKESSNETKSTTVDLSKTCFYITPIGEDDSEERLHADLLLSQIVEPAIEELEMGLTVVRADKMTQPGMISQQILLHVLGARLVVADLSFHNPNVFYELAIRHATGLPTVLIGRTEEKVPFDIADLRVVRLDMASLYTFVPQMEAWRAELSQHARQALEQPDATVTPVSVVSGGTILSAA